MFRFRNLLASLALLLMALWPMRCFAVDLTDLWYSLQEPGWGVDVVQSNTFLFVTFFIYGPDNKPTWYTGQLVFDGTRYAGGLYATQGSYWAVPWDATNRPAAQQVGTVTLQPADPYNATLIYSVAGIGSVTKSITRQTLTAIPLGGTYGGAQAGTYSACPTTSQNGTYNDTYTLTLAQTPSGVGTLTFTYGIGATCTLSGNLEQHGQLYRITGGSYKCTGNLVFTTTATIDELKATAQGIEGRFTAPLPTGCRESARFSGVLL